MLFHPKGLPMRGQSICAPGTLTGMSQQSPLR